MTIPVALFLLDHPTEHVGVVESTGAAPVITSDGGGATADVSVNTGDTAVTTVVASDTGTITYSIVGGAEAGMFEIDPDSGELAFTETSVDGVYEVIVAATSDWGIDRQIITVTVEAGYHADAVHFGAVDCLGTVNPVSCTDSPTFSLSFWFKFASSQASHPLFIVDTNNNFAPSGFIQAADTIRIIVNNSDLSRDLSVRTTSAPSIGDWHHILFSCDCNFGSGLKQWKIYLDDVDAGTLISDNDAAFDIAINGLDFRLGDDTFGSCPIMDMADFWLAQNQNLLTAGSISEATRRKFIGADGKPVDLGADGSTPTGTSPTIFFSGDATAFLTNRGDGGAAVFSGTALTDASTSPSD